MKVRHQRGMNVTLRHTATGPEAANSPQIVSATSGPQRLRCRRVELFASDDNGIQAVQNTSATALTIRTDRARGTADLLFHPRNDEQRLLADLHDTIVAEVDGTRHCGGVRDALIAIRKRDYGRVITKFVEAYRGRGFEVFVE